MSQVKFHACSAPIPTDVQDWHAGRSLKLALHLGWVALANEGHASLHKVPVD